MREIELYDIISLQNGKDYTVIRMIEEKGKMYFLLAQIDENENPNMDDIRIVEEIEKSGKKMVKEINDENVLKELGELFSSAIDANI